MKLGTLQYHAQKDLGDASVGFSFHPFVDFHVGIRVHWYGWIEIDLHLGILVLFVRYGE